MADSYFVTHHVSEVDEAAMEDVLRSCIDVGFGTAVDGSAETAARYESSRDGSIGNQQDDVDTDQAIAELAEDRHGRMKFYSGDGFSFELLIDCDPDADPISVRAVPGVEGPTLMLRFAEEQLSREYHPNDSIVEWIDAFVDINGRIAERLDAEYAWSGADVGSYPQMHEAKLPTGEPLGEHVEDFGWLTVLSPTLVEALGGREHVLDAPAWRIDELDSGHVVLVQADHPLEPTEEADGSLSDHLLDA